ncbi:hypothetical protein BFJ63_vAg1652 [Fusarium oxysporum f. sp. narcissi]|uniref:LysM domain-containing protein n=3 Tax=Fusarium oxysporum TaxID=5507 RepID=A0A420PYS0_FUSOX|nr:hypothetical protein BFJ65_g6053 [Fusarium oxysporum f. sp. cepae]RKK48269.1 hypothetical protein BFJ67_g7379 [Fusarium oxysporum f. sp. cepae]RKK50671.1 hypothetical protein BFJ66_g6522 [Fusarium oxysporum f. sp. cepae]RKK97678.1 hypothetical protein BFJ68_g13922 [Fusarium oxysporum]RYC95839.1 hypothetical protein BFJ63_vAg1652 [Fusarium oxysporum f. sp. narcissi]
MPINTACPTATSAQLLILGRNCVSPQHALAPTSFGLTKIDSVSSTTGQINSNLEMSSSTIPGSMFGPQFGQYNSSTNGTGTTTPQVQDPYTYNKIAPPKGAKVPKGTTERCGGWHVADKADSCARICAAAGIHIDLLLEVNTNLGDAQKCSDNLAVGNAYCVRPNYDWKVPFPVRTEVTATYYFTYDTREPTKAA